MEDHIGNAERFIKLAENKLQSCIFWSANYGGAAEFFSLAAKSFEYARSWDQAGDSYVEMSNCYLKMKYMNHNKLGLAYVYMEAASCYKKTNIKEAIPYMEKAADIFLEFGNHQMCARYYKEIAEWYEKEKDDLAQANVYYKKAAQYFKSEGITSLVVSCSEKIAQYSVLLGKYDEAIEIYEDLALSFQSSDVLSISCSSHIFIAGICQLCKGDVLLKDILKKYKKLYPTFSETYKYKILVRLAAAIDEKDKVELADAFKQYNSIDTSLTKKEDWKATLLSRLMETIKDNDDLT